MSALSQWAEEQAARVQHSLAPRREPGWLQEIVAEQSARAWLWVRYGIRYEIRRTSHRVMAACERTIFG